MILLVYAFSVTISKQVIAKLNFFSKQLLLEDFGDREQLQLDRYLLTYVCSFKQKGFIILLSYCYADLHKH